MLDRNYVINLALRDTDMNYFVMHLYNIPIQIKAKTIVELGAGQSTFAMTAAANVTGGEFYSIDLSLDARGRLYDEDLSILDKNPKYHFIGGDDMEIVKTWDKEIDFLLIDTSHTLEHTQAELAIWPTKVRKGGIIAMHDTAHEAGTGVGCRQALDEFMESKEGENYRVVHLLDPKIIGMSILIKL